MSEIVGSKKLDFSCSDIQLQNELKLTDIYLDLCNFNEMSQLELSKKLPKWKKIFNDKELNISYNKVQHLKTYCGNCEKSIMFNHSLFLDHSGHCRKSKNYCPVFWKAYMSCNRNIYKEAEAVFIARKENNTLILKIKMEEHQKQKIACECSGYYSLRNKVKHSLTLKHIKFCQESRN